MRGNYMLEKISAMSHALYSYDKNGLNYLDVKNLSLFPSGLLGKVVYSTKRSSAAATMAMLLRGIKEDTNNNDGAFVREFQYNQKILRGAPWCGSFVNWCYNPTHEVNKNIFGLDDIAVSSSQTLKREAKKRGYWASKDSGYKPQKGDLVIWTDIENPSRGHVGIVSKVQSNGSITVIHGNFDDAVVEKKYRTIKDMEVAGDNPNSTNKLAGFIRLSDYYNRHIYI